MDKGPQSKHLIIITGEFPFLKTETFLETEIIYLSKVFDKITIVPTKSDGPSRVVPGNVIINTSYSIEFKKNYSKLRSLASLLFLKGLLIHKKYLFNLSAIRRINSFVSDALITQKWLAENVALNPENSLVYTYWFNGKTFGAELISKKHTHIKVVTRAHRYDLYDYWFKPAFWPFRQKVLQSLDYLYLISNDGENYLNNNYNLKKGKYGVFRLGVMDNKIITSRSSNAILRLVSVSGLVPVKRIEFLARYLVKYCEKHSQVKIHWTHIGDGFLKPAILKYLNNNLPKNFVYDFKGQKPNEEIFNFYKNNEVDLFINISESEGLPVSIMEAQSCGILVAAPDVGGVSEIVNENSGVLLPGNVRYEDIENLLNNIADYLLKKSSREIITYWNKNYNSEYNYEKFAIHLSNLK